MSVENRRELYADLQRGPVHLGVRLAIEMHRNRWRPPVAVPPNQEGRHAD